MELPGKIILCQNIYTSLHSISILSKIGFAQYLFFNQAEKKNIHVSCNSTDPWKNSSSKNVFVTFRPKTVHSHVLRVIYMSLRDSVLHFYYRPRSKGDNTFGSVRPSVRLCVCVSVCLRAKEYTMTHEMQSKTSVCLSVIQQRSRSKSCAQRLGAFN